MDRQTKLKRILPLIALVLIAVIGGYCYFQFRVQTPQYTLEEIEHSFDKHDVKTFHRYVDLGHLLNNSFDDFINGLLDSEIVMPENAREAVGDFVHLMKAPILSSFESAIEQYVATGSWDAGNGEEPATPDAAELLTRSGLYRTEFREIKGIRSTEDANRMIADVCVYQQEAEREFVFEITLIKSEEKFWRVDEIRNFGDFVTMVGNARRERLEKYLTETSTIMDKHDRIVREAEIKYGDILSSSSLGNQETRNEIRLLMTDVIQKDWEERKQELFSVTPPEAAKTLHHLRLRICDLHIEYAQSYALWMTDKKVETIRDADSKLKEAKTLEQEARILSNRMNGAVRKIET